MKRSILVGLVFFGLVAAATGAKADVLYAAEAADLGPSNLYILNPSNGAVSATIGPIGYEVTGLAIDPITGTLYGGTSRVESFRGLLTIDKSTGVGTQVGAYGTGSQTMADLAFDAAGNLYGWLEPSSDDLYSIDKTTGAATLVGNSGLNTANTGLAIGPGDIVYLASLTTLYQVNKATGAVIPLTELDLGARIGKGLTFDHTGTLFGVGWDDSSLVTIDTTSGAVTVIGDPGLRGLDALAFEITQTTVPEPGTLALFGIGLAGLALRRRKAERVAVR